MRTYNSPFKIRITPEGDRQITAAWQLEQLRRLIARKLGKRVDFQRASPDTRSDNNCPREPNPTP
jgi:hypothetical protein